MNDRLLTLKDMTRGSGCTPRTVRYYERQGLLRALRSAGGHRLFAASELERLDFIIALREAGWSLEEVTAFLQVRDSARTDGDAIAELESSIAHQVAALQRKIDLLRRLHKDLQETSRLLPVCRQCASTHPVPAECGECRQVPPLADLPRSFRLLWRARELEGAHLYDECAADGNEACLDDSEAATTATEP